MNESEADRVDSTGSATRSLAQKIAALPEWPKWEGPPTKFEWFSNWASVDPSAHICVAYSAALARLALAFEWINTSVPHLEGCPWRGLTRDAQGLLPDCRCGRDALLAALEVPK